MTRPLISHPSRNENTLTYSDADLTDRGDLRLEAHNAAVAERATRLYGGSGDTVECLRVAAVLHDFGKATPQFQAYVRPEESADYPDEETTHARLGALATWYVLGELESPDRGRLAGTLAVARHHQALPDAAQYTSESLARAFEEHDGVLRAQLDAIDETWPDAATALLDQTGLTDPSWEAFYSWATSGQAADELRDLSSRETLGSSRVDSSALPRKLYDRLLRYWSAITLADKTHAMDIPNTQVFDLETLDRETIERYISDLRETSTSSGLEARLNDERERARRQSVRGVHEWLEDSSSQIATLTLPTGLGKTFTGLSAAFETRDHLSARGEDSTPSQIIYALPYTSIIEQTRELFEDPELWGADPQKSALTVHHYLSETVVHRDDYDDDDTTAIDDETASLLGEAWRDGTVLTTFVQLFESLAGPTNRQGLKLPALESSIIILDEPQALPKDWWGGIQRLLDVLTDEYDARVIAMTATQPSLVRNRQTQSLLAAGLAHDSTDCPGCKRGRSYETALPPAPKRAYFSEVERVQYTIDPSALTRQAGVEEDRVGYGTAADRILSATERGESTLAVCNTIESSITLTEEIQGRPGVVHLGGIIESVLREQDIAASSQGTDAASVANAVLARISHSENRSQNTESQKEGIQPDAHSTETNSAGREDPQEGPCTYLLTLNSRFRPFDREVLIHLADALSTSDHRFILVSTQAIEAGVDLSFKTVFRDIAPLDSIVQAAGRCNRSYEWGESGGQVVVWMLGPPGVDNQGSGSAEPPAYYVYERGATDAGIPGHLELISDVLQELPSQTDITDTVLARDAVTEYFEEIAEKSLWSGDLQEAIEDANARWLGRQSLIGGVQTFDVLVGVTEQDSTNIDHISNLIVSGDPDGYDRLQDAGEIRVSLPKSVIEEVPQLARVDRKDRSSDGVQVFQFTGDSGLEYNLESGLVPATDPVSGRFTL